MYVCMYVCMYVIIFFTFFILMSTPMAILDNITCFINFVKRKFFLVCVKYSLLDFQGKCNAL